MQVQKEAAAKEYANTCYDQPYQAALYENSVLLEAQRWHTDEYESVIGGLESADLEVQALSSQSFKKPLKLLSRPGRHYARFGP